MPGDPSVYSPAERDWAELIRAGGVEAGGVKVPGCPIRDVIGSAYAIRALPPDMIYSRESARFRGLRL